MTKKHIFSIGIIYFFILFIIALFVKDGFIQYNNEMFFTAKELSTTKVYGDPVTFINTALQIAEDGWVTNKNRWVFKLWPPGFVLLETLIIKIFGPEVPILFVLQIMASILFSIVLTLLYKFISQYYNIYIAFLSPLIIFMFPVSRAFLLEPLGISFGESFSIGFFLLFIILSICSITRNSLLYALIAGIFLGLSAYFRSSFGAILISISFFSVLIVMTFYLVKIWKKKEIFEKSMIINIIAIIFAAIIINLPWKIYKYTNDKMSTAVLTFKTLVKTNETLKNQKAGWVIKGRGNMMCLVDKNTCGNENSNVILLIKTFIMNPIKWYSIKADVIGSYWFANINGQMVVPQSKPTIGSKLFNWLILLMLLSIIILTIQLIKNTVVILLSWINVSLFSVYIAIFTIAHYEARYFYFPKIIIIFMFIILTILFLKEKMSTSKEPK